MQFIITNTTINGLKQIILQETATKTKVAILPIGAMLHEFSFAINDTDVLNVIDNYPTLAALEAELEISYKSSKLSPFVCRMDKGTYMFNNKVFTISKLHSDGSAIHGLLYNKVFEVVAQNATENSATVMLRYVYNSDDAGYPFHYTCLVTYTLLPQNNLQLQTTIINHSLHSIYMSDGWHPYFTLGNKINDCTLQFAAENIVEFNEALIPTGNLLPYQQFNNSALIGNTQLDNCFTLQKQAAQPLCTLYNPTNKVAVHLLPDSSYPYLQIYTPPHRNSIAIENLSSAPNAFNNTMGLIQLEANSSKAFNVTYQLSCRL